MILPGFSSYVLLVILSSILMQNVLSYEKPAWATVVFDLSAQEVEQQLKGEPSNGRSTFGFDISKRSLEKLYVSGAVLLVTVIGLSILCISLKRMKNIKPSQTMTKTPAASEAKNESTQNDTKMLELLVKNTYMMNKYMKYVMRLERKELKSKLRTKRKIYETESDASLPVYFCHDSGQDSA